MASLTHNLTQEELDLIAAQREHDQAVQCDSDGCKAAIQKLIDARNAIYKQCTRISDKESARNIAITVASIAITAMIAAWVLYAETCCFYWSIVLLIVAIALSIAAAAASAAVTVLQYQVEQLKARLRKLQDDWDGLVEAVRKSCNDTCMPNLVVPRCSDGTVTVASEGGATRTALRGKVYWDKREKT